MSKLSYYTSFVISILSCLVIAYLFILAVEYNRDDWIQIRNEEYQTNITADVETQEESMEYILSVQSLYKKYSKYVLAEYMFYDVNTSIDYAKTGAEFYSGIRLWKLFLLFVPILLYLFKRYKRNYILIFALAASVIGCCVTPGMSLFDHIKRAFTWFYTEDTSAFRGPYYMGIVLLSLAQIISLTVLLYSSLKKHGYKLSAGEKEDGQ